MRPSLAAFGRIAGSAAAAELGRLANEHPPRLRAFDAKAGASTASSSIPPITG